MQRIIEICCVMAASLAGGLPTFQVENLISKVGAPPAKF
jgi:hypothetical protein